MTMAWNPVQLTVDRSQEFCMGLEVRSTGIAIVDICYQAMASEDCKKFKRHSVSYSDL
jgi:hypothetical protein